MLKNYLKICFKVLVRRKFFTAISLFGICFTLTVLLVVAAFLDHLFAPEAPETELGRTLVAQRLVLKGQREGAPITWNCSVGYAFLDQRARDIPGVESFSIVSSQTPATSFVDGEKVVSNLKYTDGAYWDILRFEFLEGGPFTQQDELEGNFVAVINEATRRRFFGNTPALNKTLEADGCAFRVVGVVSNVPRTRLAAVSDIWAPHSTAPSQDFRQDWTSSLWQGKSFEGLFLAETKTDFARIRAEYDVRLEHFELGRYYQMASGTLLTRVERYLIEMESDENARPDTAKVLTMLLTMLAVFLILPTTNLISINLSRFMERSAEIGVRKTFGASSAQLVGQFVLENVILCGVGGVLALIAAALLLEGIEAVGWLPYADLKLNLRVFGYAIALATVFGLLSGAYPAWRTSRLHPVTALRGGVR